MTSSSPFAPAVVHGADPAHRTNGLAIASMVLGLWSIVIGIIPLFIGLVLTFAPTVLAVVFGIIGVVRASRGAPHRGFAVTGLVLGSLVFLLYFVGFGWLW